MKRTLSAYLINLLANQPHVRPWLGNGVEDLDLTGLIADPSNFAFVSDDQLSALFFKKTAPGLYDFHVITGVASKSLYRDFETAFRRMFIETDALEITCRLPDGNTASAKWAKWLGFRPTWRTESSFDLMGEMVGCSFGGLTFGDWIYHNGLTWTDEMLECVTFGNMGKGVALYNRWALTVDAPQASVLANSPPVLEIGGVVLEVTPNGFTTLVPARSANPLSEDASCLSQRSSAPLPH